MGTAIDLLCYFILSSGFRTMVVGKPKSIIDYNEDGVLTKDWFMTNNKHIGLVNVYPLVLNVFKCFPKHT
jgi:hypothetical protein